MALMFPRLAHNFIKKLLLGQPIEKVVNPKAMSNPGCLDWYIAFAKRRAQATPPA
ncbi:MAG: hypothetical protein FWG56_04135 [Desulfovibrionaceae bacterium]|jgi:acetoacetyl-CoA synthetase|nr:hypothetical protein [Desulfovibrionaceae bacterium]